MAKLFDRMTDPTPIPPTSHYGCGADDCVDCYGNEAYRATLGRWCPDCGQQMSWVGPYWECDGEMSEDDAEPVGGCGATQEDKSVSTARFRSPYAVRLRGVAAAGYAADPTDARSKALHRQARALEAAVKVGADRVALVLIEDCRRTLAGMAAPTVTTRLSDAIVADGREALNRIANMIRCNDPDPSDPPVEKVSAT